MNERWCEIERITACDFYRGWFLYGHEHYWGIRPISFHQTAKKAAHRDNR
jgi:hypothetical protein